MHYTNYTTPQLQLQLQLQVRHTYYTLQLQLHYTTLQLQLHYTTLHPAVVGEVTTATSATSPKNTTSTTFRSISLSYRCPIFETSATALCSTTRIHNIDIDIGYRLLFRHVFFYTCSCSDIYHLPIYLGKRPRAIARAPLLGSPAPHLPLPVSRLRWTPAAITDLRSAHKNLGFHMI